MNNSRLDDLCERWRDCRLDEAETRELNELLRTSTSAREHFRAQARFHGLMHTAVAAASVDSAIASMQGPTPPSSPQRRRWLWSPMRMSVAAALLVAIGGALVVWHQLAQAPTIGGVVARLGDVSGAQLSYQHGAALPTQQTLELHAAPYVLDAGVMEVVYANGARILFQAPARFDLLTPESLHLHRGRLTARVPPSAIGFTVTTPTADVIDLGTEFGVSAGEHASEVHVFEGEVLVKTAQEPDPLLLREQRASRIDQTSGIPTGVDYHPNGFMRTLSEPGSDLIDRLRGLGPLALYRMSTTDDGRTLRDDRSDGYHGQVFTPNGRVPWAAGFEAGTALSLGGAESGAYGVITGFPKSTNHTLTVCAWVYANRRPRWASIVKNWAKDAKVNRGGQFHFGLHKDDGDLEAHVHDRNGDEVLVRERLPLPLDQWHFVAFTLDGTMLRLYRNGIEIAATPCNGLWDVGPQALGVGVKLRDEINPDVRNSGYWDGRLDNVAIFHRALTAVEIASLSE